MDRTVRHMIMGVALIVAACGGSATSAAPGGAATAAPAAPTAAPAGASDAASAAAGGEVPSIEIPSLEVPLDGGAGASGTAVCDLVTADEMASVFGVDGVTQHLFPGPPDTCDFRKGEEAFVAMVLIPSGGQAMWSAYSQEVGAEPIDGLGDQAVYSPSTQLVIIRKGDAVVSIAVFGTDLDDGAKLEKLRSVGEIAAGRM